MILPKEGRQPTISDKTDIDYSVWKIWLIWIAGILAVFLSSYFFITGRFILFLAAIILLLSIFVLQSFLIKSFTRLTLGVLAETLAAVFIIAIFYRNLSLGILLIAAALLYLFVLWGHYRGYQEAQNSIKISYFRVAYRVLPAAMSGLAIFIALIFGFSVDQNKLSSKVYFDYLLRPISLTAGFYLPDFSPEMSAEDFLINLTEKMFVRQNLIAEIGELPEEQKQKIIEQAAAELRKNWENYIGSSIETNLPVADNVYKIFRHKINDLFLTYPPLYISLVLTLVVFFLIKGASFFFYWLIVPVGFLIYEALIISNFLVVHFESRDKEIVILK